MGLRLTQGNEKRLGPASTLYGTVTLSLSSRPERRDLRFRGPFLEMFFDRSVAEWRDLPFLSPRKIQRAFRSIL
jgi:hypothetical protein